MNRLKPFLISCGVSGSSVVGFFYIKTFYNSYKYQKQIEDMRERDNTRLDNEYFGINWGSAADNLIKEEIDSGDIIYLKYECTHCFKVLDMMYCHSNQMFNHNEFEYDQLAISFRNKNDLYVIYNHFGQLQIKQYAEFISQPYYKEISYRKMVSKDSQINQNIQKYLNQLFTQLYEQNQPKTVNRGLEHFSDLIKHCGIINRKFENQLDILRINDFDSSRPISFKPSVNLQSKVVIRSNTNKNINSVY